MSKIHYLVALLVLCAVGYLLINQVNQMGCVASHMAGVEIVKKVEVQLSLAYRQLKRFPDGGKEFENMVLGKLELDGYPQRMMVENFIPGNQFAPAFFQVKVLGKTMRAPVIVTLEYYGCDYHKNFLYKGKLMVKSPLSFGIE